MRCATSVSEVFPVSGRCRDRTDDLLVVSENRLNAVLTWENAGRKQAEGAQLVGVPAADHGSCSTQRFAPST